MRVKAKQTKVGCFKIKNEADLLIKSGMRSVGKSSPFPASLRSKDLKADLFPALNVCIQNCSLNVCNNMLAEESIRV